MKLRPILLVLLLTFAASVLPTVPAADTDPKADTAPPSEEDIFRADPTPNLVDFEPNDDCAHAQTWPPLTSSESKGLVGGTDSEDWSRVGLLRTETLAASTPRGLVTLEYALDCQSGTSAAAPFKVTRNGWFPFRVAPTETLASYRVRYDITPNDASGPGTDISNVPEAAHIVNAMPPSANPWDRPNYPGSLPRRDDQPLGPDVDWFRIGTSLAQAPGNEDLSLGLLTVYFNPDCYGESFGFTLYQGDLTRIVGAEGCGPMLRSCIAASYSPVYAKLEALPSSTLGAGYDFSAEITPLAIVSLEGGTEFTELNPQQPWCDSLTPQLLGLMGRSIGVVDSKGVLVAKVTQRPLLE